jgi:hypothetical protein
MLLSVFSANARRVALAMAVILGGLGIFINSYQGVFNYYTRQWFAYPIWGLESEYMLDWKYPQFLANPDLLARRSREYQEKLLQPYTIGETIEAAFSRNAIFDGWYSAQYDANVGQHFRWSQGRQCRIDFRLAAQEESLEGLLLLRLKIGAFREQTVSLALNDRFLGTITLRGAEPSTYEFQLDGSYLRNASAQQPYQRLEFRISDPVDADHGKTWAIGVRIWEVRFQRIDAPEEHHNVLKWRGDDLVASVGFGLIEGSIGCMDDVFKVKTMFGNGCQAN